MEIKAIETEYKSCRFRSRLEARWAVFLDALHIKWEYEPEGFDLTDLYLGYLAEIETSREEAIARNAKLRRAMLANDITLLAQHQYESLEDSVRDLRGENTNPFAPEYGTSEVTMEEIWQVPEECWPVTFVEVVPPLDTSLLLRYLPDFYLPDLDYWLEIKPTSNEDMPWTDDIRHMLFARQANLCVLFGQPGEVEPYDAKSSYHGCVVFDAPYYWCECPDCGAIGIQFDGRSARNKHKNGCKQKGDKNYNINSPRILDASRIALSARFEHGEKPNVR